MRIGRHLGHKLPVRRSVCRKRQLRFHLRVLRKVLRVVQRQRAAARVHLVRSLPRPLQPLPNPMRIAQKERRRIHQQLPVLLRLHRKSPKHRLGKRLFHRHALFRRRGRRAVPHVRFHQQHLPAHAREMHHAPASKLPAVQAHVVRTKPIRQLIQQQKILIQPGDFEIKFPRLRVPIQRKQPLLPLHPRHLLAQRLRPIRRPRSSCASHQNHQTNQRQKNRPHTKRPT